MERVCKNRIIFKGGVYWITTGADKKSIYVRKANPFGIPLKDAMFLREEVSVMSHGIAFMTHEIRRQLNDRQRYLFFDLTKESQKLLKDKPQTIFLYKVKHSRKSGGLIVQVDPSSYKEEVFNQITVKLLRIVQRL